MGKGERAWKRAPRGAVAILPPENFKNRYVGDNVCWTAFLPSSLSFSSILLAYLILEQNECPPHKKWERQSYPSLPFPALPSLVMRIRTGRPLLALQLALTVEQCLRFVPSSLWLMLKNDTNRSSDFFQIFCTFNLNYFQSPLFRGRCTVL